MGWSMSFTVEQYLIDVNHVRTNSVILHTPTYQEMYQRFKVSADQKFQFLVKLNINKFYKT